MDKFLFFMFASIFLIIIGCIFAFSENEESKMMLSVGLMVVGIIGAIACISIIIFMGVNGIE